MSEFVLDKRLAADTAVLGDLSLSRALLMNDRRYPWVILVPRLHAVRELHHLKPAERHQLLDESCLLAEVLEVTYAPDKLNVGALGNMVPQLHLHHIARYEGDPAWPGPVWGHSPALAYEAIDLQARLDELRPQLGIE